MSLDFVITGFGNDKRVVLKDDVTLEERPVMSYKRSFGYIQDIKIEPGVKCLVGILEREKFRILYEPPGRIPVLVKKDKCMHLSLNGYECLVDLREEEVYTISAPKQ